MKAILVIDDMPTTCINCPCFKYEMDDTGICCANVNDERAYGLDIKSKPNWCPLKPLPHKREAIGILNDYERGKILGFNSCLKIILGEIE